MTKIKRLVQCLLIAGSLHQVVFGQQTNMSVPVVRFENLRFVDNVPYQRSFYIQGKRSIYRSKSDLGRVIVRQDGNPIDTAFWWIDAAENDFKFFIKKHLEFNKEYSFEFNFFTYAPSIDSIENEIRPILIDLIGRKLAKKPSLKTSDVVAATDSAIVELGKNYGSVKGTILSSNSNLKPKDKSFNDQILAYVKTQELIKKISDDEGNSKIKIIDFTTKTFHYIDSLIYLKAPYGILADDKDRLRNPINGSNSITPDFFAKLKAGKLFLLGIIKALSDGIALTGAQTNFLKELKLDIADIQTKKNKAGEWYDILDALAVYGHEIESYTQSKESLQKQDAFLKKTQEEIKTRFQLDQSFVQIQSRATVLNNNKTEITTVDELETVRFAPVVGFGMAPLNVTKSIDWRFFGFLAIKYYLGPVDKRVPEPYLVGNRISVMAGVTVGNDLAYKGQELKSAGLNAKPLVAVGYDFGKLVGMNLGAVFFQQESTNPLLTGSRLRSSAFISLTIDADLFNRLKSLLSNQKYKIN